ncbi:MAG: type II toxin-antitoxin system VapC family toxin, partial [Herminiimonas sp.]|nr:type II toxin-antitoxin system VapC family toxin [Herminiimonas sp.]
MIGLDTNVLVRYIAQDDAKQSPRATALIDSLSKDRPGFIPMVCLVELVWVMQSCYQSSRQDVIAILNMLVRTQELRVENIETVINAIRLFAASKADFSDCLIERSAHASGCDYTVSLDAQVVKSAGMRA